MRGLVETLNKAKMPDFPIVVSLYIQDGPRSQRNLATIACERSYFTDISIQNSDGSKNVGLEFVPGKEDEFWEMISKKQYPFADMLSFEWRENLALACRDRYSKVDIYLESEDFLYRDINLRKNDIRELQTELEYMEKIAKMA